MKATTTETQLAGEQTTLERAATTEKQISLEGFSFNKPLEASPQKGEKIWIADPAYADAPERLWRGNLYQMTMLEIGLVHLSQASAIAHVNALIAHNLRVCEVHS